MSETEDKPAEPTEDKPEEAAAEENPEGAEESPAETAPPEKAAAPEKDKKGDKKKQDGSAKPPKPSSEPFDPCEISPSTSAELIPQEELENMMKDTLDMLNFGQEKVNKQKLNNHGIGFMLSRLHETLDAYYKDYYPKLNNYLVHSDQITASLYGQMCLDIPVYGDYVVALENYKGQTIDIGGGKAVNKDDLLNLVKMVTDNYYAAGKLLRTGRLVIKDVNNYMSNRAEIYRRIDEPYSSWMSLQNNVNQHLDDSRNKMAKIMAYVKFLKTGETSTLPPLDISGVQTAINNSLQGNRAAKNQQGDNQQQPSVTQI